MKWRLSALLFLIGLCPLTVCLPHQYHFIGSSLSWLKAREFCRDQYTDLATVFNAEDMSRLLDASQGIYGYLNPFLGQAWIGLQDNLTSWRWSFLDSPLKGDDPTFWGIGQPDNFAGDQMCVTMGSTVRWQDTQCSQRNPLICYDGSTSAEQRFILVEQELSWSDAQLYCRKHYTDLASVRNKEEIQEIQSLIKVQSVWIGLYRTREWSDQSVSTYRFWKKGQPDNLGLSQHCTATDLGDAGLWSDEQCSRELAFVCYTNNEPSGDQDLSTTTTATTSKISTIRGHSPSMETTSPVDQSVPIPVETTNQPVSPIITTNTVTQNKGMTTERDPTSPEITSDQTPQKTSHSTVTSMTPHKRTTTGPESTTGGTTNQPALSTNTDKVTQNKGMTTERNPTSPEMTSVTSQERTTTHVKSTLHVSEEMASPEQPSTPLVHQTRPFTSGTTNQPVSSTTTDKVTQNKGMTTERDPTSPEITSDHTPQKTSHSTITSVTPNKRTTTEPESITGHLNTEVTSSSKQPSTTVIDQTRPITKHVISLRVKFTSNMQMSEEMKKLFLLQFQNLLIDMGLPTTTKVGLK